jgi:hypothetical protein
VRLLFQSFANPTPADWQRSFLPHPPRTRFIRSRRGGCPLTPDPTVRGNHTGPWISLNRSANTMNRISVRARFAVLAGDALPPSLPQEPAPEHVRAANTFPVPIGVSAELGSRRWNFRRTGFLRVVILHDFRDSNRVGVHFSR